MHELRFLAIPGSLRRDSANAMLLRAAAGLTPRGVVVEHWAGLSAVPPFDEDIEHDTPAAVTDLRDAVAGADALLVSTPEYNGSIPGQLKNALDWASRPYGESVLSDVPVAVVSASPSGYGAARAAEQVGAVLTASGGTVVGRPFSLRHAHDAFTDDGRLADPEHEADLSVLLDELTGAVVRRAAAA